MVRPGVNCKNTTNPNISSSAQPFSNYDYRSANYQYITSLFAISTFHLERIRNGKSMCGRSEKMLEIEYVSTLLGHFSNSDYRSANNQIIDSIYIHCENFSFPS